jgi:cyclic beta-1,2-glucan synthetase
VAKGRPQVEENGVLAIGGVAGGAALVVSLGEGEKAVRLLRMLNPVEHARDDEDRERYKIEPYVISSDVYSLGGHVGRGGWTWYTGAAAWIYRVWLEEVFGFQRRGDTLTINPVIPKDWTGFRLQYRYQNTLYRIVVENPDHCSRGVTLVELDGIAIADKMVTLRNDALPHEVRVVLGTQQPVRLENAHF